MKNSGETAFEYVIEYVIDFFAFLCLYDDFAFVVFRAADMLMLSMKSNTEGTNNVTNITPAMVFGRVAGILERSCE